MSEKKVKIDWILLIFLILLVNQAIFSLKLLAFVFVYIFRPDWKFGFKEGRLPRFYPFIILLSLFTFFFITREFTINYISAFLVGCAFWLFSLMASHQLKLSVERFGFEGIYRTIKAFTIIHFVACIMQFIKMIIVTRQLNPYEGLDFPYGMSAGDNIYGILLENSYYNIMVSSVLAIFFMFQRNTLYTIFAITCLVLVFGNLGTIIFASILLSLFLLGLLFGGMGRTVTFRKLILPGRYHWIIPIIIVFIIFLYIAISPSNYQYVAIKIKDKVFSVRKEDKNNYASMIEVQKPLPDAYDFNQSFVSVVQEEKKREAPTPDFTATNDAKRQLTRLYISNLQGKNLSVFETIAYLKSGIKPLLFGAGTSRFSSMTAKKVSGMDSSRLFMNIIPHYRSEEYEQNHYMLTDEREKSKDKALLSTANWPDSLYNQILGEYGLIGAVLFIFFYLGYFLKQIRYTSYTIWLMLLLLLFAHLNYTFETLCMIQFFELLSYADIQHYKLQRSDERVH